MTTMSTQILDEEISKNCRLPSKKRNKKRKKKNNQTKLTINKKNKRKQCKIPTTMSEWAENFTFAATWQLKHQVAYWKARATSLEYENKILHDIIRKNQCGEGYTSHNDESEPEEPDFSEEVNDIDVDQNVECEDLEVSEEFIQFLMANAKYKEDARQEREKLKAMREANAVVEIEESPQETADDRQKSWQELYGAHWQRISTLEMTLHSQFINESDKSQPVYWPHLPLNMKFN